ncbi:MAG TPA: hypothetical protein VGD56_09225 [Gemmatirosa sp.]
MRTTTSTGFALAGTLTHPAHARGPVPVVTIAGSGPHDRDEHIAGVPGYAPFRQIADTLGRRGIAVLRLDDRGVGASGGTYVTFRSAGDRDVSVHVVPAVDRLVRSDVSGATTGYAALPSKDVPPAVLGAVADWLAARLAHDAAR